MRGQQNGRLQDESGSQQTAPVESLAATHSLLTMVNRWIPYNRHVRKQPHKELVSARDCKFLIFALHVRPEAAILDSDTTHQSKASSLPPPNEHSTPRPPQRQFCYILRADPLARSVLYSSGVYTSIALRRIRTSLRLQPKQ